MSYRKPTSKSKHGVAAGWPVPAPTPLSQDLDRAAARRAAERLAEPYVPSPIQQQSQPAKEQSMSYTSSERVSIKVTTMARIPGRKPGKFARVSVPKDILLRLGPKAEDIAFEVELGEDGILLRPANGSSQNIEVPSWAE